MMWGGEETWQVNFKKALLLLSTEYNIENQDNIYHDTMLKSSTYNFS